MSFVLVFESLLAGSGIKALSIQQGEYVGTRHVG